MRGYRKASDPLYYRDSLTLSPLFSCTLDSTISQPALTYHYMLLLMRMSGNAAKRVAEPARKGWMHGVKHSVRCIKTGIYSLDVVNKSFHHFTRGNNDYDLCNGPGGPYEDCRVAGWHSSSIIVVNS